MSFTHLSNYIRFFNILSELELDQQITQKEKHQLKVNFTLKDYQLINMIAIHQDVDDEDFKFSIINYIKSKIKTQSLTSPMKVRSKSYGGDTLLKSLRRNSIQKEQFIREDVLEKQIEDLNDSILQVIQTEQRNILSQVIQDKLKYLSDLLQRTSSQSPTRLTKEDQSVKLIDKIQQNYLQMKKQFNEYMKSHILLMDENLSVQNLFGVIDMFVKNLVDVDHFSFIFAKDGFLEKYSSIDQAFTTILLDLQGELDLIQNEKLLTLEENNFYPKLSQAFQTNQYQRSFLIKVQKGNEEIYFCFHQLQTEKPKIIHDFLCLVNEYQFFEEINQLAIFLSETIKQARVQSFTPLEISHMIQDIGIAFIRCSKYLFIDQIAEVLQKKYVVDKHISNNLSHGSSPSLMSTSITQHKTLDIDFKDSLAISLGVHGMDLGRKSDSLLYKNIQEFFFKYQKFIHQCFERTTYYKFFIKSSDQLIFEFDKQGQVIFVSRPISKQQKEEYHINFVPQYLNASYTSIFKNPKLISHIENHLQDPNKWHLNESKAQYEVFMKMEEKSFKGFVVIFQQGWFSYDSKSLIMDIKMQNKLKRSMYHQESIFYFDNLEQSNPQIQNSVVQMFKPIGSKKSSTFQSLGKLFEQKNSIEQFDSKALIGQKQINNFIIEQMCSPKIENINNFNFNVLTITDDWLEKQRVVFEILRYHNFLEQFKIPNLELSEFLAILEYKYNKKKNEFHNYDHAISVMQGAHSISLTLQQTQFKGVLNNLQLFALIFGALCHDVSHRGRTNIFEINSFSNLAIRYHDKSVLEQHHAATAIKLMTGSYTSILINMPNEQFREFRRYFISNILYTDITEHFKLIKEFEGCMSTLGQQEDDHNLLSGMIIHTSDFSGTAKKFEISKVWSHRVNQEFQHQYELEGNLGYPQLPFMKDLDNPRIMAKSEYGFVKFIVRPLWSLLSRFLEDKLQENVDNLDETIIQWESQSN